jgi:hypothetical protein
MKVKLKVGTFVNDIDKNKQNKINDTVKRNLRKKIKLDD